MLRPTRPTKHRDTTAITATSPDIATIVTQVISGLSSSGIATTDIGRIAEAVTEVAKLGQSPEGQKTIQTWRDNAATFTSKIESGWNAFIGLFK